MPLLSIFFFLESIQIQVRISNLHVFLALIKYMKRIDSLA